MADNIRVLLAKLGLDVHNRGVITVARELRDAGMEVIYIGNALPKDIITAAVQEGVDVVGVSSLGGAHLTLGRGLIRQARRMGLQDQMVFVIGGVFPPVDAGRLLQVGFDGVFSPGATRQEIVSFLSGAVSRRLMKKGSELNSPV